MRKVVFWGLIACVALFAGCHDGYSTYSYSYRSAPYCGPVYHHEPVYYPRYHGHGHYHGCDY